MPRSKPDDTEWFKEHLKETLSEIDKKIESMATKIINEQGKKIADCRLQNLKVI